MGQHSFPKEIRPHSDPVGETDSKIEVHSILQPSARKFIGDRGHIDYAFTTTKKITTNLENFSYNKIIANLHEMSLKFL